MLLKRRTLCRLASGNLAVVGAASHFSPWAEKPEQSCRAKPSAPLLQRCFQLLTLVIGALTLAACANQAPKLQQLSEQQQQQAGKLDGQASQLQQQAQALDKIQQTQSQMMASVESLSHQLAVNNAALTQQLAAAQKRDAAPTFTPAPAKPKQEEALQAEAASLHDSSKLVIGRVEWVWVEALHKKVKARIDTGATLSSIHATKIERFERDGQNWVRFFMRVNAEGETGGEQERQFEVPLARSVKIRQASAEEIDSRPVVRLRIRLGRLDEDCEFSLTDREAMNYPVLLGRKFLRDIAVVDVALKFTQPLDEPSTP